jgi:hypothetical protein
MQGVYHIDDDYIPQLRELASDNPTRMEWEISFGGFFNNFFSSFYFSNESTFKDSSSDAFICSSFYFDSSRSLS